MISFKGIKIPALEKATIQKEASFGCKKCGCEHEAKIKPQVAADQVKFTGPLTSQR